MQSIGASLLSQFEVLSDALRQAIGRCPDDQWAVEGNTAGASCPADIPSSTLAK